MITKTLHSTSGKLKVSIPSNLNEITVGQVIAINAIPDITDIEVIAILSGIEADKLKKSGITHDQYTQFSEHVKSLAHQINYLYKGTDVPKQVTFGTHKVKIFGLFYVERDHIIKVPTNLAMEEWGSFVASKDIIVEEINRHINLYGEENWQQYFNPSLDAMATVLAHYFYSKVTRNEYDEQSAESFKPEILKLPIQIAMPIARHFFLIYPNLLKQKIGLWGRLRVSWKNAQALRRLKNSGTSIH